MKTSAVAAVGWLVSRLLLVAVASGTARSQSVADDKPATTQRLEKAENGAANTTTVADQISAYSAPVVSHSGGGGGEEGVAAGHNDLGRTFFTSAVLFSGFALAAAFVWLAAPLFGYKVCAIAGNCGGDGNGNGAAVGGGEDGAIVVNGGEEASSLFPFSLGYRHNNAPYAGYRKRSLRYVGPILKTLSSAYEHFQQFSSTPKAA